MLPLYIPGQQLIVKFENDYEGWTLTLFRPQRSSLLISLNLLTVPFLQRNSY